MSPVSAPVPRLGIPEIFSKSAFRLMVGGCLGSGSTDVVGAMRFRLLEETGFERFVLADGRADGAA